jgi:threonine/homoserine/homoserine lactone efflux protein
MCAVSVAMAGLLDTAWGVAAGFGRAYFTRPRQRRWLGRASGLVLIGGGVWLSLARRPG